MGRAISSMREEINKSLEGEVRDPILRAAAVEFFIDNFDKLDPAIFDRIAEEQARGISTLIEKMGEYAKTGHVQALRKNDDGTQRRSRYLDLKFSIHRSNSGPIICPDTMICFATTKKPKPVLDKDDTLDAVIIPISSEIVLIGSARGQVERSRSTILSMLASVSNSFFVANSDTMEFRRLRAKIGINAVLIPRNYTQAIVRDTVKKMS